ncbi:hypothetical protein [Dyadobacter fermentans]|uniref:Group-specific protein n=1 Tax=Dyadobacter fermentans (strain ATCC 700827 / DSM 18053 / CIP 107007 / KCTC 52180 / NS114) TaxID=471854 RepID=C6VRR9_DYAFD|nr:hypothetical protein [Dyadobacter fermentans]ACT92772.1 group-specific protein [Dyadobacter fermentans DSM 18053]
MREEILLNQDNPLQLEKLYRGNKPSFKAAFNALYPEIRTSPLAEGWYQRLNFHQDEFFWGTPAERSFVIAASLFAALLAKLPEIFSIQEDFFYPRNLGFIVGPALMAYFAWKNNITWKTRGLAIVLLAVAAIFINWLPRDQHSDTLILSCIHLPLLLLSMLGIAFHGGKWNRDTNWLEFLRYLGELVVMSGLLVLAGGLTTGITLGLFHLIGWNIENFYGKYIIVCGLAAVPIVATFITRVQPTLVSKIPPVIAKLFSPVALVMLVVYLGATLVAGKSPYHDREFLLLFNGLLIGVMALIFFSIAETDRSEGNRLQITVLFLLSAVTLLVNSIALSAVLFRISEWGLTPNRAAVLGANVLMLAHLFYVGLKLFSVLSKRSGLSAVGASLVVFLPLYTIWSALVVFVFPFLFGFE